MQLSVALEHRFARTPDGTVWTESFFPRSFWNRYLGEFDSVRLIARVRDVAAPGDGWKRVDGSGVTVAPIPYYVGPLEYVRRRREVIRATRASLPRESAVILRVSSQIANCLEAVLWRTGHPYGVEVVADPYGIFAPGAIRHPLRRVMRWWFPMRLRRQCRKACAASYVTREALQSMYPPDAQAFHTNYSSVELGPEWFEGNAREPRTSGPFRVAFVGTLETYYKALDVVLQALDRCKARGLDFRLTVVGDGRRRPDFEALASSLGLDERVQFAGLVPGGAAVREFLDEADLLVAPSRQEGLPRAMIEAMARGLPCIGSSVGGIPELLPPDCLVAVDDAEALALKICEFAGSPARLAAMSRRNVSVASEYREEILNRRRQQFCCHLREATGDWLKRNA